MEMMKAAVKMKGLDTKKEFLKRKVPSKTDPAFFNYQRELGEVALAAQEFTMENLAEDELAVGFKKSEKPKVAAVVTRLAKMKATKSEQTQQAKAKTKTQQVAGQQGNGDAMIEGQDGALEPEPPSQE